MPCQFEVSLLRIGMPQAIHIFVPSQYSNSEYGNLEDSKSEYGSLAGGPKKPRCN